MKTPSINESVSHGTFRHQDLIPAFLDAVRDYCPAEYEQLMVQPFPPIPAYVMDEGDESEWWYSEAARDLFIQLFDLLEDVAPEGCYFGGHPGNDSDFGFWPEPYVYDVAEEEDYL
jgi:hypothetical protein